MKVWQNGGKLLHLIIIFFSWEWISSKCLFVNRNTSWLAVAKLYSIYRDFMFCFVMCTQYETCEGPELVSINNFSNFKEKRINKLSSLRLGLILHFLLKRFPRFEKMEYYITFHKNILLASITVLLWCGVYSGVYNVCIYRCSITNNYLHWNT